MDVVLDDIGRQVNDIGDLAAPDDISDDVDEFVEMTKSIIEETRGVDAATLAADNPFEPTNQLALDLGLDSCSG